MASNEASHPLRGTETKEKIMNELQSTTADEYIGGRFTSTPEDHFRQDGVSGKAVEDDGEFTTFVFEDGSRCKVNADGEIEAV